MNEASITQYIIDTFNGVKSIGAWGDTFFFYNPDPVQPDEIYFATLKNKDDDFDNASNLNRPSIFRLNISLSKRTFLHLFGAQPARATADGAVDPAYDFTLLDHLLPHPIYGRMYWASILNPSEATWQTLKPLLAEAYELAVSKYAKRAARS